MFSTLLELNYFKQGDRVIRAELVVLPRGRVASGCTWQGAASMACHAARSIEIAGAQWSHH